MTDGFTGGSGGARLAWQPAGATGGNGWTSRDGPAGGFARPAGGWVSRWVGGTQGCGRPGPAAGRLLGSALAGVWDGLAVPRWQGKEEERALGLSGFCIRLAPGAADAVRRKRCCCRRCGRCGCRSRCCAAGCGAASAPCEAAGGRGHPQGLEERGSELGSGLSIGVLVGRRAGPRTRPPSRAAVSGAGHAMPHSGCNEDGQMVARQRPLSSSNHPGGDGDGDVGWPVCGPVCPRDLALGALRRSGAGNRPVLQVLTHHPHEAGRGEAGRGVLPASPASPALAPARLPACPARPPGPCLA